MKCEGKKEQKWKGRAIEENLVVRC